MTVRCSSVIGWARELLDAAEDWDISVCVLRMRGWVLRVMLESRASALARVVERLADDGAASPVSTCELLGTEPADAVDSARGLELNAV